MLIVFKARSCANVLMLAATARQMLDLIGKDASADEGVVTLEQLPAAIAALEAARSEDRTRNPPEAADAAAGSFEEDEHADEETAPVHLHQRIQPMLVLLKQAQGAESPVTWNVVTTGPVSWGV